MSAEGFHLDCTFGNELRTLVSLLVMDILNEALSSFVAYWPHAHEEYL